MVDFGVKRLQMGDEAASRVYHLFDRDDSLRMVADFASPWLASEHSDRYVRFADSSGKTIAQMDLAATAVKASGGRQSVDYAIVLNHAVYAILSEYQWQGDGETRVYFVLHVGENIWLVLKNDEEPSEFAIYNEVPPSLISRSMEPLFSDLPNSVGAIVHGLPQYDYAISWQEEGFQQVGLVVLALAFLIDRLENV